MREQKIFSKALEFDDRDARIKYLRTACGEDHSLYARMLELLDHHERVAGFLERDGNESVLTQDFPQSSPQFGSIEDLPPVNRQKQETDFLTPTSIPGIMGELAHYQVVEILGRGGFGIVFHARDSKLNRAVAIKVLKPHLAESSPPRKRFLREARACAAIQHPNVVHIYSVEDVPLPFMVMELIKGGTLEDHIKEEGPLEPDQVLHLARQIVLGLEAAHSVGLVHRDIKPSNIQLEQGSSLRAIVTDFGLARTVDDASVTSTGVITGTPMYMAPEQSLGRTVDARSDLFSLGSVLYLMATGRPPFRANTVAAVLHRVVNDQPRAIHEIVPDCPDWLVRLIERLHEKDPKKRFQSASDVLSVLNALDQGGSQAPFLKAYTVGKPRNPQRRRQLSLAFIAVVFLAMIFILLANGEMRQSLSRLIPQVNVSGVDPSAYDENNQKLEDDDALPIAGPRIAQEEPEKLATVGDIWKTFPSDAPPILKVPMNSGEVLDLQSKWAQYLNVPVEFADASGIVFRLVPPGEFLKGSTREEVEEVLQADWIRADSVWAESIRTENPQVRTAITRPFYIAAHELTQLQLESIMSLNWSWFSPFGNGAADVIDRDTDSMPAENMTWDQAIQTLMRLNNRVGLGYFVDGGEIKPWSNDWIGYRLPTEAEWEFACRGGTNTSYWTGQLVDDFLRAENVNNSIAMTRNVQEGNPNSIGLYNMAGNVAEFVLDFLDENQTRETPDEMLVDPLRNQGTFDKYCIVRGGDYMNPSFVARSSSRRAVLHDQVPVFSVGIRPIISIETYRKLSEPKDVEGVSDFQVALGIDIKAIEYWLDNLGPNYTPYAINLRQNSKHASFDASAFKLSKSRPYRLENTQSFDDFEMASEKIKSEYSCFSTLMINEESTDPISRLRMLSIWRTTSTVLERWSLGEGDQSFETNRSSHYGWLPTSISVTQHNGVDHTRYCRIYLPGVGNHPFLRTELSDLKTKCEYYLNRGWMLQTMQNDVGFAKPSFSGVFRENSRNVKWDLRLDMDEASVQATIDAKRIEGQVPASIGSYHTEESLRYFVLFMEPAGLFLD